MKKTPIALALLLSAAAPSTFAADNEFQNEARVIYSTNSEEVSEGVWNAAYRYYFDPVDRSNGPFALNGFLAQKSNLGANYLHYDIADFDVNALNIDGTFVFDSNWFVSAGYGRASVDNRDSNNYSAEVGYYFNSSSAVSAFYSDGDDNAVEQYGLAVRSFIALESTAGVDLSARWSHTDFDDTYNVGANWYVTNSWYVGAHYLDARSSDYAINTGYWWQFSDTFSATFDAGKIIDSDVDGVNLSASIVGRF